MIEVLCGMIASGKSTYCVKKAKEGYVIVNDDSIVNAVHGGVYALYDKSFKPLYKSIEDHILHTAVAMGKHVTIDRGLNVSVKSRRRWIAMGNSLDIPVYAIVFQKVFPEIHGLRRFQSDSRGHSLEYWIDVAKAHEKRYEVPTLEEGFDKVVEILWEENKVQK